MSKHPDATADDERILQTSLKLFNDESCTVDFDSDAAQFVLLKFVKAKRGLREMMYPALMRLVEEDAEVEALFAAHWSLWLGEVWPKYDATSGHPGFVYYPDRPASYEVQRLVGEMMTENPKMTRNYALAQIQRLVPELREAAAAAVDAK